MRAKGFALAAFAAVALTFGGGTKIWQEATTEDVTFTVTDKETKRTSSNTDKYLVFTEDKGGNVEVFENTDSFWQFKYGSSDIQAELKEGHTYEAEVYGWRIPFFSQYRNIVDVDEVSGPQQDTRTPVRPNGPSNN